MTTAIVMLRVGEFIRAPSMANHAPPHTSVKIVGQMERAIGELRVAKRFRSTQADVYVELARAYFKIGEFEAGVAEMKEALLVQPDQPNALVVLARYTIDQGDAAAAREWIRRVRLQTRVDRKDVELVLREFQERFGQSP